MVDSVSDEDNRCVLQSNETNIINLINLTLLLPVLRTKAGLLTEDELRLLEIPSRGINRKAQLVQILLSKPRGEKVLSLFIEALQEEKEHMGHKNLAFQLLTELSKSKMVPPRSISTTPRLTRTYTMPIAKRIGDRGQLSSQRSYGSLAAPRDSGSPKFNVPEDSAEVCLHAYRGCAYKKQ